MPAGRGRDRGACGSSGSGRAALDGADPGCVCVPCRLPARDGQIWAGTPCRYGSAKPSGSPHRSSLELRASTIRDQELTNSQECRWGEGRRPMQRERVNVICARDTAVPLVVADGMVGRFLLRSWETLHVPGKGTSDHPRPVSVRSGVRSRGAPMHLTSTTAPPVLSCHGIDRRGHGDHRRRGVCWHELTGGCGIPSSQVCIERIPANAPPRPPTSLIALRRTAWAYRRVLWTGQSRPPGFRCPHRLRPPRLWFSSAIPNPCNALEVCVLCPQLCSVFAGGGENHAVCEREPELHAETGRVQGCRRSQARDVALLYDGYRLKRNALVTLLKHPLEDFEDT